MIGYQKRLAGVFVCALGGLAGALGALTGCATKVYAPEDTTELVAAVCERGCECTGCSASAKSDCLNSATEGAADAVEGGCDMLFHDYFDCLDQHMVCENATLYPGQCSGLWNATATCLDEWKKWKAAHPDGP
ncbi:MAG: hypothetical protein U0441_23625 [Polyangiaceae bacterium]